MEGYKGQVDHLLAVRDFAAEPRQCCGGWLGHFLEQVDLFEHLPTIWSSGAMGWPNQPHVDQTRIPCGRGM